MAKRPVSAVGNRRPITEYAKMAAAMGGHMRYKVSTEFTGVRCAGRNAAEY